MIKRLNVPSCYHIFNEKWVYKLKTSPERLYKTHWIAKGFGQQYGVDYFETFAAVIKSILYKILLALAAHYNLEIHQMNIKSVFLYRELDEKIYLNFFDNFQD